MRIGEFETEFTVEPLSIPVPAKIEEPVPVKEEPQRTEVPELVPMKR